jgi:quercetin dioxygenase-like cupin family protein
VVLSGDPTKEGPFTIRIKTPAGYKVPAHNHPTDELVTVITGAFAIGMGDKLDETRAETLKPGDFVAMPAGMNHFALTPETSVIQISSMGPFKINYVNPADNPAATQ